MMIVQKEHHHHDYLFSVRCDNVVVYVSIRQTKSVKETHARHKQIQGGVTRWALSLTAEDL